LSDAGHPPRLLALLIPLGVASHMVLAGSRVIVSLAALAAGASAFTVGVLIALYSLVPMFIAVAVGRLCDRIGVRLPMIGGTAGLVVGIAVPLVWPGLPGLYVCATVIGTAFMVFQIGTQRATGDIGGPTDRARNFSLLALAYSISGFIGPIIAGFAIDHFGFGPAFAVIGVFGLGALATLLVNPMPLPGPHRGTSDAQAGGVRALLRLRAVRNALAINVLLSIGWELNTVFMPIYGAQIGLSASEIGVVLASFAAATFVVRFAMPLIARRVTEYRVLATALFFAGVVYLGFPFSRGVVTLAALAFGLGLGLGSGQPMVMSLLHRHAPAGRIGEVVGVRMLLIQSASVAVPLVFGALGAALGLAPVFWAIGLCLGAGGFFARRAARA
jgi:MFS family permease